MKCEQAKQLMHSSVDGLLNEQELHKLNSHLDTCEACAVEFEEIKYMIQLMGEIDLKELPIGFEEELHNKLIIAANEMKADHLLNPNSNKESGSWRSSVKNFFVKVTSKRRYFALAAVPVIMLVVFTASKGLLQQKNEEAIAYDSLESTMAYGSEEERGMVAPEASFNASAKASDESFTVMETTEANLVLSGANVSQTKITATTGDSTEDNAYRDGRMIIQTASINMDVEKYDDVLIHIKNQVANVGGYVENESTSFQYAEPGEKQLKYGYITLRVPAADYDSVLGGIKALGLVTLDSSNASDITKQYRDTASEIENLKVTETRLREIMAQATVIEDILAIENELTRVRSNINSYEKQIKDWEALVDMTTINLQLTEVKSIKPVVEAIDTSLFGKAKEGFINTINHIVDAFERLIIWIIANSPIILIITLFGFVGFRIYKKRRIKHEK